jgi:hypothetical protein
LTSFFFIAPSIDKRSVGIITSHLQDDAARLQAFSGEPVRAFIIAVSSVVIGVALSFIVRNASMKYWNICANEYTYPATLLLLAYTL